MAAKLVVKATACALSRHTTCEGRCCATRRSDGSSICCTTKSRSCCGFTSSVSSTCATEAASAGWRDALAHAAVHTNLLTEGGAGWENVH